MTKTFTENDLVKFLYNDEMNEDKRMCITESLQTDFQLREKVKELRKLTRTLDRFSIKAPDDLIFRILYVSKNLHLPYFGQ